MHWSVDGWSTTDETPFRDTGLGVHVVDLPTDTLPLGARIDFTFYWPDAGRWEDPGFSGGDRRKLRMRVGASNGSLS